MPPSTETSALTKGVTALSWLLVIFYLWTSFCVIVNFALRDPAFDQFRLYGFYLGLPFPDNILQSENGHRPILPAFVRLLEIRLFDASQTLQIVVGTALAALTCLLIAAAVAGQRYPRPLRAAGILLAVLGVFWLGSARMLIHGNESVHAYAVTLAVVLAALAVWAAHVRQRSLFIALATLACIAATFSFGPGLAAFVAVIVLMLMLRMPWRWFLWPVAGLIGCFLIYFALPGGSDVRNTIAFRPLETLTVMMRWLASPLVMAGVLLQDPPLHSGASPASPLLAPLHFDWRGLLPTVVGAAGVVFFAISCLRALFRKNLDRVTTLAFGLGLFAIGTAGIVALGRLDYFAKLPEQVLIDRYIIWPCFFWLALGLLAIDGAARRATSGVTRAPLGGKITALLILLVAALWIPSQRFQAKWAMGLSQHVERGVAAMRSGVVDPQAGILDHSNEPGITLLREKRLGMFRRPFLLPGPDPREQPPVRLVPQAAGNDVNVAPRIVDVGLNESDGALFAHIKGDFAADPPPGTLLGIIDSGDILVGLGDFTSPGHGRGTPWYYPARPRGFEAYIRRYDSGQTYRLVALQAGSTEARYLATIAPPTP